MFKLEKLENTDRLKQENFNLSNILIFMIPDFFHTWIHFYENGIIPKEIVSLFA